jgi:hypothetical protein
MNSKCKILLTALSISTLLMLFKFSVYFLTKLGAILRDAPESAKTKEVHWTLQNGLKNQKHHI